MLKYLCMKTSVKQLYCSLEFLNGKIKLLVGEYYNTRFNILRSESYDCDGLRDFRVTNEEKVITVINDIKNSFFSKLSSHIEKCILVLPPYKFKRVPLKVSVIPSNKTVTNEDVSKALKIALNSKVDDGYVVVNASIVKYTLVNGTSNGISSRRVPLNEICDELIVDIDLLTADMDMVYNYVNVVTKAGLEVLDICLSNYAVIKEAQLLEQSLNNTIVFIDGQKDVTYLSLLSKGKLVNTEIVYDGFGSLVNAFNSRFNLDYDTASRLIKYNSDELSEKPIYVVSENEDGISISKKDILELINRPLNAYVEKLNNLCRPILEKDSIQFYIGGEVSDLYIFVDLFKNFTGQSIKAYYPDTIGVRDSNFASLLGSFYVYKEKANLQNKNVCCINMMEYEEAINKYQKEEYEDSDRDTLTTKIKTMLKQYVSKEGK